MIPLRAIALSFLLLAAPSFAQTRDAVPKPVPTVLPRDGVTLHGDERWLTTRAVDGLTGQPLADAELLLIAESPHPLRGTLWFERKVAADAEGFLRVRIDDKAPGVVKWGWLVIRAPGHGAFCGKVAPPGAITRLAPDVEVPVRVLDRVGNPVAGALLGFCAGSGHTPDLVHGTSDAKGLVRLRGVDLFVECRDLYVEHPDLGLAYTHLQWMPGEPPMDLRVDPAVATSGEVVDGAGKPVADAYVGTKHVDRGPWTKTDARGAFRLCGGGANDDLFVHVGDRQLLFERPAKMPFRLQLPKPDGNPVQVVDLPRPAAAPKCQVLVRVLGPKDEPLTGAHVRWIGPAPARDEVEALFDELHEIALRPGRYDVVASAHDHGTSPSTFVVPDAPNAELVLHPRALPTVRVLAPELPAEGTVRLLTADSTRDISEQVRNGIAIGVPEAPFWLQLEARAALPRTFAFAPKEALARGTLQLPWYRPTRLTGRLVDRAGKPAKASLALVPCPQGLRALPEGDELQLHEADGTIAWQTEHTGFTCLVVRPDATVDRLQVLPLVLPPRGDQVVFDLGTIDIDAPPVVQVRDAAGARVSLLRAGWTDVRDEAPPTFPLDARGGWHGPKPKAGDALLVLPSGETADAAPSTTGSAPVDLPVRCRVQGEGPWTVALPAGAIDFDVRGDDESELAYTVVLGAEAVSLRGASRVRRVPAGKLRLFVASEERLSMILDVDVPASGVVPVRCRLPKR